MNETATEFRVGNALVRIHGTADRERIQAATERFIKKVRRTRKQKRKESEAS